tara:strand:+ start:147 stop:2060 length:1914 start_codon:yes stop_codon:yes gene_type:complete
MAKLWMNDKPFEDETKKSLEDFDQLNLMHYADVLGDFIKECDTPMTIGIQGDWGIGKSTLLNMLRVELPTKSFPIVDFNTWQYSLFGQDDYLGLSAINAMLALLKDKFDIKPDPESGWEKANNKVKNALKTLKFGFGPITIDPQRLNKDDNNTDPIANMPFVDISEQMKELKIYFEEIISQIKNEDKQINKIIFFIDDIDRVRPVKALELLESLKNFFDVKDCVFVLAVDYEVVQMGMAEKLGIDLQRTSGKSFFDKIINLPFSMPTQSYSLDKYLKNLMSQEKYKNVYLSFSSMKDTDWSQMAQIAICTIGRNPRSIKRAINYMKIIGHLRKKVEKTCGKKFQELTKEHKIKYERNQDLKLRWALVCMQIAWPELYSYFVNNPTVDTINNLEDWDFLDSLPETRKLYDRVSDENEVKNNISDFFDLLYELLDIDGNDEIDHDELIPLLFTMYYTKMTEVNTLTEKPPYIELKDNALKNCKSRGETKNYFNDLDSFLNDIIKSSHWFQNKQIVFKRSTSKRYISLIYNRKRLGTLVSLTTQPFAFRISMDDEHLIGDLKKGNPISLNNGDEFNYEEIIKDYEGKKTGWGETEIDIFKFFELYSLKENKRALRRLLNQIYIILTSRVEKSTISKIGVK